MNAKLRNLVFVLLVLSLFSISISGHAISGSMTVSSRATSETESEISITVTFTPDTTETVTFGFTLYKSGYLLANYILGLDGQTVSVTAGEAKVITQKMTVDLDRSISKKVELESEDLMIMEMSVVNTSLVTLLKLSKNFRLNVDESTTDYTTWLMYGGLIIGGLAVLVLILNYFKVIEIGSPKRNY